MADRKVLRVLVVDDEPLGCERLVTLLGRERNVEVVGIAEDGDEAVEAIRKLAPDLVFLDVQMPEKTGIEVVHEVGPGAMPMTIFVTAFDQYAVHAFDLAAVDYLVKPYDDDRFREAVARARQRLDYEGMRCLREQLRLLLQEDFEETTPVPKHLRQGLERIVVHTRGKMRIVPVAQIDYVTASGPYVELHVGKERHLVREGIQSLEGQLDPARFVRIHRSVIVRLELIESVARVATGGYEVQLKNGVHLPLGRSRREALERRLRRT